MYKLLFIVGAFCLASAASSQIIIINGDVGNRPLIWSDFRGIPDNSSPYFANTWWNLNYKYSGVQFKGDEVILDNLEVKLEFDPGKSWLKKGKDSDELLVHEQGHFNIGLLCLQEMLQKIKATSFTRTSFNQQIQKIFHDSLKKHQELGAQYDDETRHSTNKEKQLKWNEYFTKHLSSL